MYNIAFPELNLYFNIDNVAFNVLGRDIYWYGIIIAVGILICFFLAKKDDGKYGIKYEIVENFAICAIPFSIIGARLYYVLFKFEDYKNNLIDIFKIWNGGLAIYGGIIAAVITAVVYCRITKIKLLDLLDYCAPFLALGQAIGRWGNFINREAYGAVTDSFFRMEILNEYGDYISVHPTFLYESIGLIIIFIALRIIKREYSGKITLCYFAGYGLLRFFVEYLRADSLMMGNIKVSMLLSGILFITALASLIYFKRKEKYEKTV